VVQQSFVGSGTDGGGDPLKDKGKSYPKDSDKSNRPTKDLEADYNKAEARPDGIGERDE